jgi:hypothetical protein
MVRRRGRTTWELLLRTSSQAGKTVAVDPIPIATSLVSRSAERFSSFHFIPGVTPDASSSRGEVRARFGVRRHPRDKMLSNELNRSAGCCAAEVFVSVRSLACTVLPLLWSNDGNVCKSAWPTSRCQRRGGHRRLPCRRAHHRKRPGARGDAHSWSLGEASSASNPNSSAAQPSEQWLSANRCERRR